MDYEENISINKLLARTFEPLQINLKDVLEEKLSEYDLSKTKVINLLNIDKNTFDDIINGTAKYPSLINIIKIIRFLDLELEEALPSILKNQTKENITSIRNAENASFIAKNFDIKKLTKIGFFEDTDDVNFLTSKILSFFGFGTIEEYKKKLISPLYSKSKRSFSDKMKAFWITSAYQCFKNVGNPNEYNREGLKDIATKLRPYCTDIENGLLTVCRALYNVGVTVIVQNHLTLTQVRGGTFVIDDKPCIVLTDLNKRYTTIWETLIHEIYHVLYNLDTIKSAGYTLTGDPDIFLIEDKADKFQREFFCGIENYKYIKPYIHNHYLVSRFARDKEVHPSFIYSAFRQFEQLLYKKSYYSAFNEFFPDYSVAIKKLHPITWKEDSVEQIARTLKLNFELTT